MFYSGLGNGFFIALYPLRVMWVQISSDFLDEDIVSLVSICTFTEQFVFKIAQNMDGMEKLGLFLSGMLTAFSWSD